MRHRRHRRHRWVRHALASLLCLGLTLGCASVTPAPPAAGEVGGVEASAVEATGVEAAWSLPTAELGSQRLYRVSYDGPEENGSFRLTLLLETPERYQVRTVDPLGRALWTLDVAGEQGLWTDHRNRLFCRLDGAFDLAAARLAPFPLPALPALLLGRLPAPPATPVEGEGDGRISYRDAEGRRWSARLADGLPAAWTLYGEDGPSLLWSRQGDESYLSDRLRGSQLRWREVVREGLAEPLPARLPSARPAGYREADCATAYAG